MHAISLEYENRAFKILDLLQRSRKSQRGVNRDYLNASIGSWLTAYNASYSASVAPKTCICQVQLGRKCRGRLECHIA
jgi:hypothetical protein